MKAPESELKGLLREPVTNVTHKQRLILVYTQETRTHTRTT